ncbi:hypothetical protein PRIPAC_87533 [Pristionchus pacificus]|uniref:ceramidase n=1 Tax=Pristionchus pacificus TaxID=54126 RepID=A0A2A6B811_PRIPA|nr:hypothetical protein PRIPAC_87533 [Pristionchus pacificus]|eukprot:PDM61997.1 hypothetical protein PRIPAC_51439 [Pristionchus pacificus]
MPCHLLSSLTMIGSPTMFVVLVQICKVAVTFCFCKNNDLPIQYDEDGQYVVHYEEDKIDAKSMHDEVLPSIKPKPSCHSLSFSRAVDTMLRFILLLLPVSLFAAPFSPDNPWGDYASECLADKPSLWDENRIVKEWYTLNLDDDPHDMWRQVATDYGAKMSAAVGVVKTMLDEFGGPGVWDSVLLLLKDSADMLTEPYKSEIHALSDLTGIQLEQLTLLNLFYEISKACTSIVAIDHGGKVIHGRLRLLVHLELGHSHVGVDENAQFRAVTFAGHLGILTAVRPGKFSLSMNSRFGTSLETMTHFFLNGLDPDQQFAVYACREMLANCETFEEAKDYVESVQLLAGAYFIMGSTTGGMVNTRAYNGTDHEAFIDTKQQNGWYVLQTNYDWNEKDIYLDDRTIPGNKCMQQLGRKRVSLQGIFQVLSSKANLNKATVYTSVMDVDAGTLYTFIQDCPDPCWMV